MLLDEMSIDKARQETTILYKNYKNKFNTLSELVQFIAKKLNLSINDILQILEYNENINRGNKMNRYTRKFREQTENSLSNLTDITIVDKLYDYIYNNPFPKDEEGIHKFSEQENINVHLLEEYAWAILSAFICGGKAYESKKTEKDFDPKEIEAGKKVEREHLISNSDNKVVNYIVDKMAGKIVCDHLSESDPLPYYEPYLKDMEDKIKADKNK